MKFTICQSFIKIAKRPNKYTSILNYFPMENADKVVYNKKILDLYLSIANSRIRDWLKLMDKTKSWAKIDDMECNENDLFIEACKKTHDKRLVVSEKETYEESKYRGIKEILDKEDARVNFTQSSATTYNISGENPTFTTGNKSEITVGDNSNE